MPGKSAADRILAAIRAVPYKAPMPDPFKAYDIRGLYGDDLEQLAEVGSRIENVAGSIDGAADVTLEQDLARRDLTINAIAVAAELVDASGNFDP